MRKYLGSNITKAIIGGSSFSFAASLFGNSSKEKQSMPCTDQTSMWDFNWDGRHQQTTSNNNKNANSPVRHLIFVRHGQCDLTETDDKNRPLTELGEKQATITGARLKALQLPINELITSSMLRAKQTGAIIAKHLPANVSSAECILLDEGVAVKPEPTDFWDIEPSTVYQDEPRIEAAFRKYFYRPLETQQQDSYTLFVGHANCIRYLICRALQFQKVGWLRFSLYHGSITWLTIYPSGRVSLRTLGDTGHMDSESITIMNYRG